MGDLIILADRLADRSRCSGRDHPVFFFDLACPFSYLAAEQVERCLGDLEWIPASGVVDREAINDLRACAVARADELRLPLVWPDRFPAPVPAALRAAAYAAEVGAGHRFALAASRLAFCGGFDLEDPEILAEAAAAAAIPLDECLAAARDCAREHQLDATGRGLRARGVRNLPVIQLGRRVFEGDTAPAQAASLLRLRAVYGAASLAPRR
jgi:2-hydroxychromene-2-carboxylate isomerase